MNCVNGSMCVVLGINGRVKKLTDLEFLQLELFNDFNISEQEKEILILWRARIIEYENLPKYNCYNIKTVLNSTQLCIWLGDECRKEQSNLSELDLKMKKRFEDRKRRCEELSRGVNDFNVLHSIPDLVNCQMKNSVKE